MTIEEYSTLMGYGEICSIEEHAEADAIYVNAGNLDKDSFCADYRKYKGSVIIKELSDKVNAQAIWIRLAEERNKKIAATILRETDRLRAAGLKENADALDSIAIALRGGNECIRFKLEKGFALSERDKAYIKDNLR